MDGEAQTVVSGCSVQQSSPSYSELEYLLMASLQLGALRTLGSLLSCGRYIELLLIPRDSSDSEKRLNTGRDDLQVDMFFILTFSLMVNRSPVIDGGHLRFL